MANPNDVRIGEGGGDVVIVTGNAPGIERLRFSSGGGLLNPAGQAFFLYELSTTLGDGATVLTFAFADPIGQLIVAYIGGVAQLPADCSVDSTGQLVFSANVTPPAAEDLVTALYIAR